MDHHSLVPFFFDLNFADPATFSCQNFTTDPHLHYHGMDVHALNSPCPGYLNQSDAGQINALPVIPLNEFRVASLSPAFPDGVDESDLTGMPQSIIIGDAPLTILDSYPDNQSCSSGNELEITEKAPANRFNPDHHLTPPPAEPANPQDSQPVAVINPLNLPQPASDNPANSAEIVDDKSSLLEQKKRRNREYQRMLRKNPDYAERERIRRNTPHYIERQKQYQMQLRKDPAYRERERQRSSERRKNPAYREREKNRRNTAKYKESQRRYRRKPAVIAQQNMLKRERLKDPVRRERFRELHKKRQSERYENDPTYAEGRRIHFGTYISMKKKYGKEEATKIASVARQVYLQAVNTPEYSGNLPQNANNNSDLLPPHSE